MNAVKEALTRAKTGAPAPFTSRSLERIEPALLGAKKGISGEEVLANLTQRGVIPKSYALYYNTRPNVFEAESDYISSAATQKLIAMGPDEARNFLGSLDNDLANFIRPSSYYANAVPGTYAHDIRRLLHKVQPSWKIFTTSENLREFANHLELPNFDSLTRLPEKSPKEMLEYLRTNWVNPKLIYNADIKLPSKRFRDLAAPNMPRVPFEQAYNSSFAGFQDLQRLAQAPKSVSYKQAWTKRPDEPYTYRFDSQPSKNFPISSTSYVESDTPITSLEQLRDALVQSAQRYYPLNTIQGITPDAERIIENLQRVDAAIKPKRSLDSTPVFSTYDATPFRVRLAPRRNSLAYDKLVSEPAAFEHSPGYPSMGHVRGQILDAKGQPSRSLIFESQNDPIGSAHQEGTDPSWTMPPELLKNWPEAHAKAAIKHALDLGLDKISFVNEPLAQTIRSGYANRPSSTELSVYGGRTPNFLSKYAKQHGTELVTEDAQRLANQYGFEPRKEFFGDESVFTLDLQPFRKYRRIPQKLALAPPIALASASSDSDSNKPKWNALANSILNRLLGTNINEPAP